mgnify:CR=1 FL=1
MRIPVLVLLVLPSLIGNAGEPPRRPVHTYSIVARDAATGDLGVAVQSHWFSVGSAVPWAEPGVGAVATQSFTEPSYGALGLALMKAGKPAPEALKALLSADADREVRQVAMVDAQGRAAAHTGTKCIQAAGHEVGEGFTVETAGDGRAALSRINAVKPDLVVLDLMLPELDGWQVCRELRKSPLTEALPIIMLTASALDEDRILAQKAGATDFLTKPISSWELLEVVHRQLGKVQLG